MTIDRVKFYVHCQPCSDFEREGYKPYLLVQSDSLPGYIPLGYVEIDLQRPTHEEVVRGSIDILRGRQAKLRADAEAESQRIEEQIQRLQAIEGPR